MTALIVLGMGFCSIFAEAQTSKSLRGEPIRRLSNDEWSCDPSSINLELSILENGMHNPDLIKYFEGIRKNVKSLKVSGGRMEYRRLSDRYNICWEYIDKTSVFDLTETTVGPDVLHGKPRHHDDCLVSYGLVHAALAGDLFTPKETNITSSNVMVHDSAEIQTVGNDSDILRLLLVVADEIPYTLPYPNKMDLSLLTGKFHCYTIKKFGHYLGDAIVGEVLHDAGVTVISLRNREEWRPFFKRWGQDETNLYQLGPENTLLKNTNLIDFQPALNQYVRETVCKSPLAKPKTTTTTTTTTTTAPTTTTTAPTTTAPTTTAPTTTAPTTTAPTTTTTGPTTPTTAPTTPTTTTTTTTTIMPMAQTSKSGVKIGGAIAGAAVSGLAFGLIGFYGTRFLKRLPREPLIYYDFYPEQDPQNEAIIEPHDGTDLIE